MTLTVLWSGHGRLATAREAAVENSEPSVASSILIARASTGLS
jgi:hypothetical protein